MLLGLAAAMSWDGWFHPPPGTSAGVVRALTWTLGCAALGWEASELGYSWARWANCLADTLRSVLVTAENYMIHDILHMS